jgi:hypothetical protein
MKKLITIFLVIIAVLGNAQTPTIGLIYNDSGVTDGYVLFTPEESLNTYLINNCGEVINEWEFNEKPGLSCYLLEDGTLLRAGVDSLELRDWDNNLLWSYPTTDNDIRQHHDIEPLPNGNILCVSTEVFTNAGIVELGRDGSITATNFRIDKIVEIQPVGTDDAIVVWEWKMSDHLIQDFDDAKLNYGVVGDHPELVDINYNNGYDNDWTHVNSVEYNEELDQVLISVRHLNEIFIIDHSTTSVEVLGHSGGNFNMGGDIIYRWGNPQLYRQGDETSQKLFAQHDARWVEDGFMDEGKISVFNNGGDGTFTFSSINLIQPEMIGNEYIKEGNVFLPQDYYYSWSGEILGSTVNEGRKCAADFLENGNVIFVEYEKCRVSEITRPGELKWSYVCPVGASILSQFETTDGLTTPIFRAEKYSLDYSGFDGKDLTSQGIIENENSVSNSCMTSSALYPSVENLFFLKNNIIKNGDIAFNKSFRNATLEIFSSSGIKCWSDNNLNGERIDVDLVPGMYIIKITEGEEYYQEKIIVFAK